MPKKKSTKKIRNTETKKISISQPMRIPYIPLMITSLLGGLLGGFSYSYLFPQEAIEPTIIEQIQEPTPIAQEITPSTTSTQKEINAQLIEEQKVLIYSGTPNTESALVPQFPELNFLSTGTILTSDGWIAAQKKLDPNTVISVIDGKHNTYTVEVTPVFDERTETSFFKINAENLNVQPFKAYENITELDKVFALLPNNLIVQNQIAQTHMFVPQNRTNLIVNGDQPYQRIITQNEFPIEAIGGPIFSDAGEIIGLLESSSSIIPFGFIQPALKYVFQQTPITPTKLGVIRMLDLSTTKYTIEDKHIENGALITAAVNTTPAIDKESPAENAGLKINDIILKVENDEISEKKTLPYLISEYSKDSTITLTILRDGLEKEIEVKL